MFRSLGAASATRLMLVSVLALSACSTAPRSVYQSEKFTNTGAGGAFSHTYPASASATCEAARRALLGQGYLVPEAKAGRVDGQKSFQPEANTHLEIAFHVVCAPDGNDDAHSTAFVNALQDRYTLKRTSNSASVGVGAFGSVSLPFGSSEDSLVKIASETIPAGPFYDRFFELIEHYLGQVRETGETPSMSVTGKGGNHAADKAAEKTPDKIPDKVPDRVSVPDSPPS